MPAPSGPFAATANHCPSGDTRTWRAPRLRVNRFSHDRVETDSMGCTGFARSGLGSHRVWARSRCRLASTRNAEETGTLHVHGGRGYERRVGWGRRSMPSMTVSGRERWDRILRRSYRADWKERRCVATIQGARHRPCVCLYLGGSLPSVPHRSPSHREFRFPRSFPLRAGFDARVQ